MNAFIGDGTGAFTAAGTPAVGMTPKGAAMADFNLDGKADIAVADSADNTARCS